jgi:hypothetical protein
MSLKFRVYKFLVFSEILVHSFKPLISDYTNAQVDDSRPPEIDGKWEQCSDLNFLDFFRPFPAGMH